MAFVLKEHVMDATLAHPRVRSSYNSPGARSRLAPGHQLNNNGFAEKGSKKYF